MSIKRKFYVATGLERAAEAQRTAQFLSDRFDLEPTYQWWQHGSVQKDGAARIREVAVAEALGVMYADLFVALLPGGRGTHTEIGMALASQEFRVPLAFRRPIILVGVDKDGLYVDNFRGKDQGVSCAFYHHPCVTMVPSLIELFIEVDTWKTRLSRLA